MTKAMENCLKHGPSGDRFAGSVLDAGSTARKTPSVQREEPRAEVYAEKKEGTTMTKEKRLDSLAMLRSLMKHPYGVVFKDIDIIRACSSESFKELEKPIDLETVKSMLENNIYLTVEAFAEDVRTIFSNAMQIFPVFDDVHKMASRLSENFEMGFKTKMESRKRKSAAASSGAEKIYVVRQEPDRKYDRMSVTGTHSVKGKDEKSFNRTVVPSAPEKSGGKLESPGARIAALKDRFSGTIKKAEMELAASADAKREAKVREQMKRERAAQPRASLTQQKKKDRESLEKYLFIY